MPAREGEEGLVRRRAVGEIALQHPLDGLRRVLRLHVVENLAPERRVRAEAAADEDVVALDGVALVRGLHLAGQEADVADVVLRAGMVAAGQVDVERAVEGNARWWRARASGRGSACPRRAPRRSS